MLKARHSHFVSRQAQIKMSKKMSSALRHRAKDMKLSISSDGYISVPQLLSHSQFRENSIEQLEECVATCEKQRFEMKRDTEGGVFIRATQGHSISTVKDDELLELIQDAATVPVCLHGTYASNIASIRSTGLNRMRRNNIHLIACLPLEEDGVVSGMRKSADTIVTIDVAGAMAAGIPFYRSSNGVILSPGLGSTGCIPAEFISEILERGVASSTSTSTRTGTSSGKRQDTTDTKTGTSVDSGVSGGNAFKQQQEGTMDQSKASVFTCDGTDHKDDLSSPAGPVFTHYCVVDFEATCLEKKIIYPQEIIEFPAVMLSASTLEVVTEFHSYVRPLHHPTLSDFCIALTGISQETVDRAPVFASVYVEFTSFLKAFAAQYRMDNDGQEPRVLFASHGDWDFKTMFPNQCLTSDLPVPTAVKQWMNVKVLYANANTTAGHGSKKQKGRLGMEAMLAQLGLKLLGRHHSGIDDSRNIARIVIELVTNRGAVPMVTSGDVHSHNHSDKSAKKSNSHYSKTQTSSGGNSSTQNKNKTKYTFV